MIDSQRQIKICDMQASEWNVQVKKSQLTATQVQAQPEDTKFYWSVGRALVVKYTVEYMFIFFIIYNQTLLYSLTNF